MTNAIRFSLFDTELQPLLFDPAAAERERQAEERQRQMELEKIALQKAADQKRFCGIHDMLAAKHDQVRALLFGEMTGIRFPSFDNPTVTVDLPASCYPEMLDAVKTLLLGWRGRNGEKLEESEIIIYQEKLPVAKLFQEPMDDELPEAA